MHLRSTKVGLFSGSKCQQDNMVLKIAGGVSSGGSITLPSSKNCTTSSTDCRMKRQKENREGAQRRKKKGQDAWRGQMSSHT